MSCIIRVLTRQRRWQVSFCKLQKYMDYLTFLLTYETTVSEQIVTWAVGHLGSCLLLI